SACGVKWAGGSKRKREAAMKGANKSFIELQERFLQNNLIVMQSTLRAEVFGWAQLNTSLPSASQVTESHFGDVWEFDLVEMPRLFDTVGAYGASPTGKPPKVYELRLLNRVDRVVTKKVDATG